MGLLSEGNPLTWEESAPYVAYVKEHGVIQLLNIYHALKYNEGDCLKWGDEIEMNLIKFDHDKKRAYLTLRAHELLDVLTIPEKNATDQTRPFLKSLWRPEYGRYMIEGTPGRPYAGDSQAYAVVESNMNLRRAEARKMLKDDEVVLSCATFPHLGVGHFTFPPYEPNGPYAQSLFVPDELTNLHPRFPFLTQNIRRRRGEKVAINVPLFQDKNTTEADNQGCGDKTAEAALPGHIYMDAMGFGMGMSCLQVTFQSSSITEARYMYDQLAVLSPYMLALTAATPIFRGYLGDIDCRWSSIAASVDDRTPVERGEVPIPEGSTQRRIAKSRYDSISMYISRSEKNKEEYTDLGAWYDEATYQKCIEAGIDDRLARHFAYLFIRDPLVIYRERVELDDTKASDHFENIQSTNWNTVRFKPPPPGTNIGWRVEFRPMEVQLTDFENAAFTVFSVLLSRVILSFDLNLYMPLSKVDENMQRAHARDAIHTQKFWFRRHVTARRAGFCVPTEVCCEHSGGESDDELLELTLNEIINGKEGVCAGLIELVNSYLDTIIIDWDCRMVVDQYLDLISKRASGELLTCASWMREFVLKHPSYKQDSVVADDIAYDLLRRMDDISNKGEHDASLLGNYTPSAEILTVPDAKQAADPNRGYAGESNQPSCEEHQQD
eukprot:TRINITY_DN36761_c0_g1_i1.p1 TRINITY_DN36761_c0_g1~~TRINITY_DN36761_c0_g1_i1.p1  ORF type:complete len:692 (-),score=111.14 TRINITY_DN36761_c0_g1_i1:95-2089(-)